MSAAQLVGLGLCIVLFLPGTVLLFYAVHVGLQRYCYIPYARRYCVTHGLRPVSWNCATAFTDDGVKSEYSIVALHCLDDDGLERRVSLLVWFLGVKDVLGIEPTASADSLQPTVPPPVIPPRLTPLEAGLPKEVPYNPPLKGLGIIVVIAIVVAVGSGWWGWSRVGLAIATGFLAVESLFVARSLWWPRYLEFTDESMSVPSGFLRLQPTEIAYDEIVEVWVVIITPGYLCVRTEERQVEIPASFLPDLAVFASLRDSLLSIEANRKGANDDPAS